MQTNAHIPPALARLIESCKADLAESGNYGAEDADAIAWRMAQHAGWYQTKDGWKRLGPDVRANINVRKAVKQPDGRYLIPDVDVFYPNATKMVNGHVLAFDADDVRQIIHNTRQGEFAGNFPTLTRVHIRPEQRPFGVVIPACGRGLNMRESPRGKGWARCELADVEKATVDDWRSGKITGLSAGLSADAAGLNVRIGHITALGGEPQALSRLPRTEVFAAEEIVSFDNQLCFSADAGAFSTGDHMDHIKLKPHLDALHAAYAALEAGEPGAEDKIKEAHHGYCQAYSAEMPVSTSATPTEPTPPNSATTPTGTYSAEALDAINFSDDPAAAFGTVLSAVKAQGQKIKALTEENQTLRKAGANGEFKTYLDGLKSKGLTFSADEAIADFDSAAGNEAAIGMLKRRLERSPKAAPSLADSAPVFGAEDASTAPKPGKTEAKKPSSELVVEANKFRESMGSVNFSGDGDDSSEVDPFVLATAIGAATSPKE